MEVQKETCKLCWGSMKAGDGRALYTAECSHIFHFNCVTTYVNLQHSNLICPTCNSTWRNVPSQIFTGSGHNLNFNNNFQQPFTHPSPFMFPPSPMPVFPHPVFEPPPPPQPANFADDEPLPTPTPEEGSTSSGTSPPCAQQGEKITIKALPEYPALSRSNQSDSFAVLVGIRAPSLSPEATDRPGTRAPLDLVAVLDVSGSMNGDKIRLLKQAVNFVIDNLGPADRLSIITFSTLAQRVTPLRRMTNTGQTEMAQAVNSLMASGATNIIAGLRTAVQVLEQRREKNPVASIILLSDGQDNQNGFGYQGFLSALRVLPPCVRSRDNDNAQTDAVPVHTFGFGSDHDAKALHAAADGSGGTFSYIESIEIIQDAFAQCLGGLLSVVAQEVKIDVQSCSPEVQIQSIPSGRYRNTVDHQHGMVYVGDLYAEEEKQFLVYLSVPKQEETDTLTTQLLDVKCSYKDPLSNDQNVMTETKRVEIKRPPTEALSEEDKRVRLEVDREKNRVSVATGISEAQSMAERGELQGARSLLEERRACLFTSFSAQIGDNSCAWLDNEVREIEQTMASQSQYDSVGRAFALSKESSHMYQRAATQAVHRQHQQDQLQNFRCSSQSTSFFAAPQSCAFSSGISFGASSAAAPSFGSNSFTFGGSSAAAPPASFGSNSVTFGSSGAAAPPASFGGNSFTFGASSAAAPPASFGGNSVTFGASSAAAPPATFGGNSATFGASSAAAPPASFGGNSVTFGASSAAAPPASFGSNSVMFGASSVAAPPTGSDNDGVDLGTSTAPYGRMGYETSFMRQMVTKSQQVRQSTKQHGEAAEGGSNHWWNQGWASSG